MSVGGRIVDIVPVSPSKWWIDTLEPGSDTRAGRTVAVYCDPQGEPIQVGDSLWWQGRSCYWTPHVNPDGRSDVKLPKIGYSGVAHPHKPRCPTCDCTLEFCRQHGVCADTPAPARREEG